MINMQSNREEVREVKPEYQDDKKDKLVELDKRRAELMTFDKRKKHTTSNEYCRDCDTPEGMDW